MNARRMDVDCIEYGIISSNSDNNENGICNVFCRIVCNRVENSGLFLH